MKHALSQTYSKSHFLNIKKKIEPYFGSKAIDEINKESIDKWLNSFKGDYNKLHK